MSMQDGMVRRNKLKGTLRAGGAAVVCGLNECHDPRVVFAMATGGADAVFIDLEHESTTLETASLLTMVSHAAGITPVVRISQIDYTSVTRVLDAGCQSIFVPGVRAAAEVRQVLDLARYHPLGHRGFKLDGMASVGYRNVTDIAGTTAALNDELLVGLCIETPEAIEDIDELLVPGVDWALVGLFDLAQAYGVLGEHVTSPQVLEAMAKVRVACRERSIAYGAFAATPDHVGAVVGDGASIVMLPGAIDLIRQGVGEAADALARAVDTAPLSR